MNRVSRPRFWTMSYPAPTPIAFRPDATQLTGYSEHTYNHVWMNMRIIS